MHVFLSIESRVKDFGQVALSLLRNLSHLARLLFPGQRLSDSLLLLAPLELLDLVDVLPRQVGGPLLGLLSLVKLGERVPCVLLRVVVNVEHLLALLQKLGVVFLEPFAQETLLGLAEGVVRLGNGPAALLAPLLDLLDVLELVLEQTLPVRDGEVLDVEPVVRARLVLTEVLLLEQVAAEVLPQSGLEHLEVRLRAPAY